MSIAAINSVKKALNSPTCEIKPLARFVLLLLAEHAGKDGTCWPSRGTLATLTGTSQPSIKRALRELERGEFIRRHARHNASGAQTTSLIEIVGVATGDHRRPGGRSSMIQEGVADDPGRGSNSASPYKEEPSLEPTIEPSLNQSDRPSDAYGNLKTAFNGSTDAMLADVQRFMGPTAAHDNAVDWLTGTLSTFGKDRTLRAWTIVTAKIGQGSNVRQPLPYWAKTADSLTAEKGPPDRTKMSFIPSRHGAGKWVPKETVQ